MPKFHVDTLEVMAVTYEIEADSPADAVDKYYRAPAEELTRVGQPLFNQVATEHGMSREDNEELALALEARGHRMDDCVIDGIESVTEVTDGNPA